MHLTHAIARRPGADVAEGLSSAGRGPPDPERMGDQHTAYVRALEQAGLAVEVLEALPGHPDACFVEDVALVLPEIALVTRPGAPSRRAEADHVVDPLSRHRTVIRLEAPGTLDGGDVLVAGRRVFVGISQRTDGIGAGQLAGLLDRHGYETVPVPVGDALHLKSSVNLVAEDTLVVAAGLARAEPLRDFRCIVLDEADAGAANSLRVNDTLLVPAGHPRAREQLEDVAPRVVELDVSEASRLDAGLTCMSLRW